MYTSGFISIASASPNPTYCLNISQNAYYGNQATTYLIWNLYDGSQTILRDTAFNGQPQDPDGSCNPQDRGKVFPSTDGSDLMFVVNADVHEGDGYVTGTLITRDGTRYSFSGDTYVNRIEDRNGNLIQFSFSSTSSGGIYTVTDPVGRTPSINFTEDPLIIIKTSLLIPDTMGPNNGGPGYPPFLAFVQNFSYDNLNRLTGANDQTPTISGRTCRVSVVGIPRAGNTETSSVAYRTSTNQYGAPHKRPSWNFLEVSTSDHSHRAFN